MKKCEACGKELSEDSFEVLIKAKKKHYRSICKACSNLGRNKSRSKTPEAYIRHLYSQLKYSRKKQNPDMEWAITPEDLILLWKKQKGRCPLSGELMTYAKDGAGRKEFNVSIDRIHPHRGYISSNMQLVCHRVNIMKHNLPPEEFWWWCKNIVLNNE